MKQQEAVQRVVQLEEALDRLEVERSELSQRLQAMAAVRGGGGGDGGGPLATPLKAEDSGSEVRPLLARCAARPAALPAQPPALAAPPRQRRGCAASRDVPAW